MLKTTSGADYSKTRQNKGKNCIRKNLRIKDIAKNSREKTKLIRSRFKERKETYNENG